eukprot:4263167-Pyramimonas_sp.AAC.1
MANKASTAIGPPKRQAAYRMPSGPGALKRRTATRSPKEPSESGRKTKPQGITKSSIAVKSAVLTSTAACT